jgi:hypothetical protein
MFADGYDPVLPAFPDLSGDELMLSDDNDQDDQLTEDASPTNGKLSRGGKRASRATKSHDKVSNRVAARRHREMTKERLKNVSQHRRHVVDCADRFMFFQLEKLRTWLDEALTEYEKSNQRLHETFSKLQEENNKVR